MSKTPAKTTANKAPSNSTDQRTKEDGASVGKPAPGSVDPAPGVQTPIPNPPSTTLNPPESVVGDNPPDDETPAPEGQSAAQSTTRWTTWTERVLALPQSTQSPVRIPDLARAVGDVQAERIRQVYKGKTYDGDDTTGWETLAQSGAAYILHATTESTRVPSQWGFENDAFRKDLPKREALVRGLAMGIAALEALDRVEALAEARRMVAAADAKAAQDEEGKE